MFRNNFHLVNPLGESLFQGHGLIRVTNKTFPRTYRIHFVAFLSFVEIDAHLIAIMSVRHLNYIIGATHAVNESQFLSVS